MSTYPLRLPEHVMDEVRQAASEDNVSLNQLLTALVTDGIGHRRAIMALKARAGRGDANAALELLQGWNSRTLHAWDLQNARDGTNVGILP